SVSYAAGADLNSDGSSDLLLVPTAASAQAAATTSDNTADLPLTWVPRLSEQTLDTFVGSNNWPPVASTDAYVNGDGVCHGLTPCYPTIQAAVDVRYGGDLIIVQPGVYNSFIVDGNVRNYNNLTIRGINTDAVFVDANGSSYAALIRNAASVHLEQMTLRNASYGVQLDDAGVGGHKSNQLTNRTILDHLLIYDASAYDIYIDRSSTVTVSNSTLVRAGNHVGVDMSGPFDATVDAGWQAEPNTPDAFYDGGGLAAFDDIILYCTGGGGRSCKWKHAQDANWFIPWAPPDDLEPGSTLAAGSDGQFYVVAAPGWSDVDAAPEQIVTIWSEGLTVSQIDGHLLAVPQLGQGFFEWNGSSWDSYSDSNVPNTNYQAIAENPTNGDVAIAAAWYGVFIWDGIQFTNIVTDNIVSLVYDSQGNLFAPKRTIGNISLEKYDGSQWTKIADLDSDPVMTVDDQNSIYVADGSSMFRHDGSTNWYIPSVGSITNTVRSLAYDETIDKLFACTVSGIARYDNGSWTMLPPVTTGAGTSSVGSCDDLTYSGQIFASGEWHEETPEGDLEINLASWNDFDGQWYPIGTNELCVSGEPQWCSVDSMAGGKHGIFIAGRDFYDLGDDDYATSYQKIAHYHFSTSVYSTTLNAWATVASPPVVGSGASMAGNNDGKLALIAGNGTDRVYTYDIVTDKWDSNDTLETDGVRTPITVTASAMTFDGNWLYAIMDGGEFCSSGDGRYWSCYSEGDIDESTMGTIDGGVSLTYDPKFDTFYAFTGGNGSNMLRYNTQSNTWELLPSERFTPSPIKPGAGLVFIPGEEGNSLYAVEGNYIGSNTGFWRYPVPEPNKIGFENSAVVVPPGGTTANWLNLTDPLPEDFNFRVGTGSLWFNSTGLPNNGGYLPRTTADPFLDASHDVYRMGQPGYTVGYHTYTEPVTATTTTGIQAAINTGANQVIVKSGIYEEDVYLVNGVEVIGANPDWTIIRPLFGSTANALVRSAGATGASFSRFTLDGENSELDGFAVTGNAANVTLQRALIYDTGTAVTIDGVDSDLEVANVTAAHSNNGLAATSCASIDVRNSVFAYHNGAGLSHEGCAAVQLHTYNLYWANASDFGGAADAGAAELFLDPNFVDAMDYDFRTYNYSPIIDAGNPTDPAPPGAGSRADIGYVEQGRINFYVDDSYCDICINDGLTWQVDAFDTIQDALNAANNALLNLNPSYVDVPQLVVGVAPGTYHEQVTLPSHVLLMGSGAEVTTLDGDGGTAVTANGVTNSGIRDLTITNADTAVLVTGASNAIDIRHNIFTNNTTGLLVTGRGTAALEYNTLVNNGTGVAADGPGSWTVMMHNIIVGSNTGASAGNNGQIFTDYNLYYNTLDFVGATTGGNDITGQNPLFAGGGAPYRLSETSPAVDAAASDAIVPAGGGVLADLGYSELLAAPVTLLLGQENLSTVMGNSGVAAVEYGVVTVADPTTAVTATLPSTWTSITLDSPGETYSYWSADYTPQTEGLQRFYSRATDMVGNQEDDQLDWYDGSFVVDSTPPVVQWLLPPNSASLQSPLELRAQVSDYAAGEFSVEEKDIYFEVNGQRYQASWAAEPWNEDAGQPRIFRAWVDLAVDSYSSVTAVAEDKAGNVTSDSSLSFTVTGTAAPDNTAPNLTIAQPVDGSWVTRIVTFTGTAVDSGSGIAFVEVSVDGGSTWRPATVSGSDWSLVWEGPEDEAFVSYPAWVRATDHAGNVTSTPLQFTIDEVAPAGLLPMTFNFAEGSHFDAVTNLDMNWQPPIDASGIMTTLLTVDQISDTIPLDVVVGTTAVASLNANGDWYAHLAAVDAAGNAVLYHYGPWHVGINQGLAFGQRQQSIIIDGYVDVANNEWQLATEYLDDDERTIGSPVTYSPGDQQSFLTTWDANNIFMAWRGAWWTLDGELWIYINSGAGGSNQMIQPLASAPGAGLPFDADYAVQITDPLTGTLWEYSGGWQVSVQDWAFAQGSSGDTEIRLPLFGTSNLETLAFGLGDDGNIWAIFPATNALNPVVAAAPAPTLAGLDGIMAVAPSGWQTYHWDDITTVTDVAANQPQAAGLELSMASNPTPMVMPGPNSTIEYVVRLTNHEDSTLTGKQIAFIAIPFDGVIHESIVGASCATTNPWQCTLDPLPPGASTITLTMRLASDLTGIEQVSMFAMLQDSTIPPEFNTQSDIHHLADSLPPEVSLLSAPYATLGSQTFFGTADDGNGIGVDYVEVRPAGGSWQRVEGTSFWTADLTVSPFSQHGDVWEFEVRAVDLYGQMSAPLLVSFTVDLLAPVIALDIPAGFNETFNDVTGTVNDSPSGSETVQLLVQIDDQPWREASIFAPNDVGEQTFLWTWNTPAEDYISHTMQIQAVDLMGNMSSLAQPQTVWVDNVTPVITVTNTLTQVVVQDYRPGVGVGGPVISGQVTDGGGLAQVQVFVELPDGTSYRETAVLANEQWQYTPVLQLVGDYRLRVEAQDLLGNAIASEYYNLNVIAAPDSYYNTFYTQEDTPLSFEPLFNDLDLDGDILSVDAVAEPEHGTAVISPTTWIIYTPTLNFNGTDVFTYTASDGVLTDTATVTITVTPVNDPPVIGGSNPINRVMGEDGGSIAFSFNSSDVDGDSLNWDVLGGTGTAVISSTYGSGNSSIDLNYTPQTDSVGLDSFTVQVSDGWLTDTVTVNIMLTPADDPPRAADDFITLVPGDNGKPMLINVMANDVEVDGQTLSLTGLGSPSLTGTAQISGGKVIYTPTLTLGETETFTYTISDGGLEDTAVIQATMVEGDASGRPDDSVTLPGIGDNGSITVQVSIPPDVAGTDDFTLVYRETAVAGPAPQNYKFAGLAFTLDAYVNGVVTSPYTLTNPITLTITYSDADIANIMGGEQDLNLWYWTGSEWSSAGITLVAEDLDNNQLTYTISHLTEFALFGWDGYHVYLPVAIR
ncbi:MAG: tandem-95 repeat protein, partial [Ardenticatenaceae bacterium]|nr:tandem-95 repeat protein [Ardenticatenaceae bacterium]